MVQTTCPIRSSIRIGCGSSVSRLSSPLLAGIVFLPGGGGRPALVNDGATDISDARRRSICRTVPIRLRIATPTATWRSRRAPGVGRTMRALGTGHAPGRDLGLQPCPRCVSSCPCGGGWRMCLQRAGLPKLYEQGC